MSVAAIVPAYNEAPRIKPALKALSASPLISEILVIDDGSEDDLESVVTEFPKVVYVKNPGNKGKGYCLERGSRITNADFLLFCDADLKDLDVPMLSQVISPVLEGRSDMFIGIFATPKRAFYDRLLKVTGFPSGINSGLRALKREVWESLPAFYKNSYCIESGLNYLVKWKFSGPLYEQLSYTQIPKEAKWGISKGFRLRTKMNFEVILSILRVALYERFFGFGRKRN